MRYVLRRACSPVRGAPSGAARGGSAVEAEWMLGVGQLPARQRAASVPGHGAAATASQDGHGSGDLPLGEHRTADADGDDERDDDSWGTSHDGDCAQPGAGEGGQQRGDRARPGGELTLGVAHAGSSNSSSPRICTSFMLGSMSIAWRLPTAARAGTRTAVSTGSRR